MKEILKNKLIELGKLKDSHGLDYYCDETGFNMDLIDYHIDWKEMNDEHWNMLKSILEYNEWLNEFIQKLIEVKELPKMCLHTKKIITEEGVYYESTKEIKKWSEFFSFSLIELEGHYDKYINLKMCKEELKNKLIEVKELPKIIIYNKIKFDNEGMTCYDINENNSYHNWEDLDDYHLKTLESHYYCYLKMKEKEDNND